MKSLFADNVEVAMPEWLERLLEKTDSDSVTYLREHNEEYKRLWQEEKTLVNTYPCISKLMEGKGSIRLNAEEHDAVVSYLSLASKLESMERRELYLYGHVHCYEYLKRLGGVPGYEKT